MPQAADLDALIARAQQGDVRAFETLLGGQLVQVRRLARAFASEADADDVAQEALLKVYRSLRQFRYQSAFSTWLFAVVRSVFLDFAKSRAGRQRSREEPLAPHADHPDGTDRADALLAAEEDRQRVWQALREVPLEFRTALVLFDIEGRSYDEVAAIEAVPVGTVKSRLSRGRAHLRRLLLEADVRETRDGAGDDAAGTKRPATSSHMKRSGS